MGHIHVMLPDISGARRAFLALGGAYTRDLGRFEIIPFPGAYVLLSRADSSGGSAASTVSSVSFRVQSLAESLAMCEAAGVKVSNFAIGSGCWVTFPGDVLIELLEFPDMADPVQFSAVNFLSDAAEVSAHWYRGLLGGVLTRPGPEMVAVEIPGAQLRFTRADRSGLPTKGRCLDHIGFEVNNLEELYRTWAAAGVEFEAPPRVAPNGITRVAFCSDPVGTRIELTEKIDALL